MPESIVSVLGFHSQGGPGFSKRTAVLFIDSYYFLFML